MDETASTNLSTSFCNRMTHYFSQDTFINKRERRKMCLARCRLHRKEGWQKDKWDHSSFPELEMLAMMNNQIRISWFVGRGFKNFRSPVAHKKYFEVDCPWLSESEGSKCLHRTRLMFWYRSKHQSSAASCLWGSVQISCQSDRPAIWGPKEARFLKWKLPLLSCKRSPDCSLLGTLEFGKFPDFPWFPRPSCRPTLRSETTV